MLDAEKHYKGSTPRVTRSRAIRVRSHSYWPSDLPSYTPPQYVERPSSFAKCLTFVEGNALVNASAIISSVGQ